MKKELTWDQHLSRCKEMGITKKSYCERYDLSYKMFFYYQRKMSEGVSGGGFHEVVLSNVHANSDQSYSADSIAIKVHFSNGSILHVPDHLLERVMSKLQSLC